MLFDDEGNSGKGVLGGGHGGGDQTEEEELSLTFRFRLSFSAKVEDFKDNVRGGLDLLSLKGGFELEKTLSTFNLSSSLISGSGFEVEVGVGIGFLTNGSEV